MNDLYDGDAPTYDVEDRFKLRFTGLTDLKLPFDGTIVIPRAPDADPHHDLSTIGGLNPHDWLFYSLLHPRPRRADELFGALAVFPTLREVNNLPFALDEADIVVNGKVIILAAKGYTLLDDLHGRALFDDKKSFYSPRYPDNIRLCSLPQFILVHLDNGGATLALPQALPPITRDKGFSLLSDDPVTEDLRTALANAPFHGIIYGFDLAGHLIDGYALSLALGISVVTVENGDVLPDRPVVQLVDVHGQPLDPDGATVAALTFTPPLVPEGNDDGHLQRLQFPDAGRTLKVAFAEPDLSAIDPAERYRKRHLRIGYWPGFGHALRTVKEGEVLELKLDKDLSGLFPPFLRLCVLHPGDEFQTTAGGALNAEAVHADSGFRLYTDANRVAVFNSGDDFFADLYETMKDTIDEQLEGVYLTNWSTQPQLFMHGAMVAYGIARNDSDREQITGSIAALIEPNSYVVAALDPEDGEFEAGKEDAFVLVTRSPATTAGQSFQMIVESAGNPLDPSALGRSHRGFVRADGGAAWLLKGANGSPHPVHRLTASWKNSVGHVDDESVDLVLPATPPDPNLFKFPIGVLALGIDGQDPPRATLRRVTSYAGALCLLAGGTINPADGSCSVTPFNDAGLDLRIVFVHLRSGHYEVIPLDLPGQATATDLVLHTFERLICTDEMAVALIHWPGDPALLDLDSALLSRWRRIAYTVGAFERGELPLTTEEWGGWLRHLIATTTNPKFDLKALYWEHIQANLSPGPELDRGLPNSAALTAVLNRIVLGRRGRAIRDRATRPLGAFHQKAVVLVKRDTTLVPDNEERFKVIAYVGGMDLAFSRWDTEQHHHLDPERQSGSGWRDVHVRLDGDAALDVLKNFKQRWDAVAQFTDGPCQPVNTVEGMGTVPIPKIVSGVDGPGPLVQITRTWPAASCHAHAGAATFVSPDGELGTLESYLKAVRNARKFILINDQYLFGIEIAQAIREALLRRDGPECAIIMLPKNLSENPIADPLIYKTRKRAFDTLFHGATFEGGVTPGPHQPHRYTINAPGSTPSLRDRIVILSPINRASDDIYVHAKQMIVDDAFMSIGSANFTFRGTTYEMEINAAVVDRLLYQGGGAAVREQRIEVCRRMLGLPKAYATQMQDWNACFHILKALETETANNAPASLNLHPLKPMAKQLNPAFAPLLGPEHAAYNADVAFVMDTDNNSAGMLWVMRTVLDIDGRETNDDDVLLTGAQFFTNLAYLSVDIAYLGEFPHSPPSPYARLRFDLNAIKSAMQVVLGGGGSLTLVVDVRIHPPSGSLDPPHEITFATFAVTLDGNNVVIQKLSENQLLLPLHNNRVVDVEARLDDQTDATLGSGSHTFDPAAPGDPIPLGAFVPATIDLTA